MEPKTIILENSYELHIDPLPDAVELAVKRRSRFGLDELSRIRLTHTKRIQLGLDLLGEDLPNALKTLAGAMANEMENAA